jgi:hypothetical protein
VLRAGDFTPEFEMTQTQGSPGFLSNSILSFQTNTHSTTTKKAKLNNLTTLVGSEYKRFFSIGLEQKE